MEDFLKLTPNQRIDYKLYFYWWEAIEASKITFYQWLKINGVSHWWYHEISE